MYGQRFAVPLLALGFFAGTLPVAGAWAGPQTSCADRAQVLRHLAGTYSESPVAMGLANNGGLIEVLNSPDRRTFTIIITMPDGVSCMIAAGEAWQALPGKLARAPGF